MSSDRAVIFDLGGVLVHDVWEHLYLDPDTGLAARYGLDRTLLKSYGSKAYGEFAYATLDNEHWTMLERRYWTKFVESVPWNGIAPTVDELISISIEFIKLVDESASTALLNDLGTRGVRMAICSNNNEFWFHRQIALPGLSEHFDSRHTVLSCRVGASKSDPSGKMFQALLNAIEMPAEHLFYIDDRQENVDRAAGFGIPSFLFPSHDPRGFIPLRSELVSSGILES